ncbi:MAG: HD domain-containing protein [Candidatus Colwellbacteria bacterium]|nr:HD domain-containing protein [Candidatus Colwellbacteria bacterium]
MDIIEEIRNFVENECRKPESKYGYEPFTFHFIPMVAYADKLTDKLGGDKEIILISAWLHDIGSIIYGREDHHITGALIAEEKLKSLDYPDEKIELVKKCIRNHRGSCPSEMNSIEEQIIAEADVMSNFDNLPGIFKAALVYEGLGQGEAKESVRKKLERKWEQLRFDDSKAMIRPKYEAVILLLK